jgi:hypothetical protein
MSHSTSVFSPDASNIKETSLRNFLDADICGLRLNDVPGIGPHTVDRLKDQQITNPIQLLGKFQQHWSPEKPSNEYANEMVQWLRDECGCRANRNTIVMSVLSRLEVTHPGFFAEELLRMGTTSETIPEEGGDEDNTDHYGDDDDDDHIGKADTTPQ